jgi:predicted DNA-binding transcriptional regulator AlpA
MLTKHELKAHHSGDDGDRFLTGPDVARRCNISDVSLWRWLGNAELKFPQPSLRINRRRFWKVSDLVAWERSRARTAA